MTLRGKRVLARCDPAGELDTGSDGRVEIRYRPSDRKAYRAAKRNLKPTDDTIFEDAHCVESLPQDDVPRKPAKKAAPNKVKVRDVTPPRKPVGDEILAYTDGACTGNPGPCGLGVVMLYGETQRELSEFLGDGTNNIGELTAILRAAEAVPDKSKRVRIFTDSKYSIGVLTKGWKAKKNKELIVKTRAVLATLENVEILYVPGHAGVELNEVADQLAVAAVTARTSSGWTEEP